jgi:hypothetical protein
MSVTRVSAELRRMVRERAGGRCEYCLIPEAVTFALHEVDHIVAEKHGGLTEAANLCLACALCNGFKGSDLTSIDPVSGQIVTLFHPRTERWEAHFVVSAARFDGKTPTGRATARLLRFNDPDRLRERTMLQVVGMMPR